MTNAREDTHIARSALQNLLTTSWTISKEKVMFVACPVSLLKWVNECSSVVCQLRDHYFGIPWQCCIERDGDSGESNDKAGCNNGSNVVFSDEFWFCVQYSGGCIRACRLQEDRTSTACILHPYRSPVPGVMLWTVIGYTTRTSLFETTVI